MVVNDLGCCVVLVLVLVAGASDGQATMRWVVFGDGDEPG